MIDKNKSDRGTDELTKHRSVSHPGLWKYLLSSLAYWYWTTIVFVCASWISLVVFTENTGPLKFLRYVLGSFLILWLPGYSLAKALFPIGGSFGTVENTALKIVMSLTMVSVVGLLLDYSPWGVNVVTSTSSLAFLAVTFSTVGIVRNFRSRKLQ